MYLLAALTALSSNPRDWLFYGAAGLGLAFLLLFILSPGFLLASTDQLSGIGLVFVPFGIIRDLIAQSTRALADWVKHYSGRARIGLSKTRGFLPPSAYSSVPVAINGAELGQLSPGDIRRRFLETKTILVWGPGGSGKTTLALQFAAWALSADKEQRIAEHLVMPVVLRAGDLRRRSLIESAALNLTAFLQLKNRISERLVELLFRSQQMFVIVDGTDEFPEDRQEALKFREENPNAIMLLTSRQREIGLDIDFEIKMLPLRRQQISDFIRARLEGLSEGKRDVALHSLAGQLAAFAAEDGISPLFVNLYVDAFVRSEIPPASVPDVILSYLEFLSREPISSLEDPFDPWIARRAVQLAAWESLRKDFRPRPISVTALSSRTGYTPGQLTKLLVQRYGIAEVVGTQLVRFKSSVIAEYLAAMYVVDHLQEGSGDWDSFLQDAKIHKENGQSFLRALLQCAQRSLVPTSVETELMKLSGLAHEYRSRNVVREAGQAGAIFREFLGLPPSPIINNGVRIAHQLREASYGSGDFYNFISRPDQTIGVFLVDVEGHGLPATATAQAVLQVLRSSHHKWGQGHPRRELLRADHLIRDELKGFNTAVTMNFTELDPEHMVIRHANAGMPYPMLFRVGQAQPEFLIASGVYVGGGYGDFEVSPQSVETSILPGDILTLVSDGVLEATDPNGRLFGQRGVITAVARAGLNSVETIVQAILDSAARHTQKPVPDDDQVVIAVQFGTLLERTRVTGAKTLAPVGSFPGGVEFTLLSAGDTGAACHEELREFVKGWAVSHDRDLQLARQIWVATWEAVQNAVRHGSRRGDVIRIRFSAEDTGDLTIKISQPSIWHNWETILGPERMKEIVLSKEPVLGGTVTMLRLASHVDVLAEGTAVIMAFSPQQSSRAPGGV